MIFLEIFMKLAMAGAKFRGISAAYKDSPSIMWGSSNWDMETGRPSI